MRCYQRTASDNTGDDLRDQPSIVVLGRRHENQRDQVQMVRVRVMDYTMTCVPLTSADRIEQT